MGGRLGRAVLLLVGVCALIVAVSPSGATSKRSLRVEQAPSIALAWPKWPRLSSSLARQHGTRRVLAVEIEASDRAAARAAVRAAGGYVQRSFGRLLEARVPASGLGALGASKAVRFAREPVRLELDGIGGQGVAVTAAAGWHEAGYTGRGVKVAVIDGGFGGLARRQAEGELPSSLKRLDLCSRGGYDGPMAVEHGTAVAEIVHEMAPGAQLHLICVDTLVGLAKAAAYARTHGIAVVNHSVSWFNTGRGDGSGGPTTPDAIVAQAAAAGSCGSTRPETAAGSTGAGVHRRRRGRLARVRAGRRGQHDRARPVRGRLHQAQVGRMAGVGERLRPAPRSGGRECQRQPRRDRRLLPQCADRHAAADRAALLLEPRSRVPVRDRDRPCQRHELAAARSVHLARPRLRAPGRRGQHHRAGFVTRVLAVGAVCWLGDTFEAYSSRGPTIDGRVKPDLVAPANVSSATYGGFKACAGSGFAGTSAAAPHVAGAAALVKQAHPDFDAAALRAFLSSRALDLGVPGHDELFGLGKLLLGDAPAALPRKAVVVSCVVPKLRGRSIAQSRRLLAKSNCSLGTVRGARKGRVATQNPRAGKRLAVGSKVKVTLRRASR